MNEYFKGNLDEGRKIIIYGAGKIGVTVAIPYLDKASEFDLLCFAVSDKTANCKEVLGIPVYGIEELVEHKEDAVVLVGVSRKYQEEVQKMLDKYGFKNVIYTSWANSNYKYYSKLCIEKYEDELARWYSIYTGMTLDWQNLRTYNEKLQWLKLYDQVEKKRDLSDKYMVRRFVREKIGEKYLVPLLGCWDTFSDINFDNLPDKFVLKCNHGSGWNKVVHNKAEADFLQMKKEFDVWMSLDYAFCSGFEMNYKGIRPRIIAEQMLCLPKGEELRDYKVFVFGGKAKIIQVDIGRDTYHKRNLYDRDWVYLPYGIGYPMAGDVEIKRPDCLDELVALAEMVGAGFRHVRVDFYIVDGKIYFGEMTFSHGSGTERFTSEEFALEMGSWIKLDGTE